MLIGISVKGFELRTNNEHLKQLYFRRIELRKKIEMIGLAIRGSVVTLYRSCGKKGCKCEQGQKHPSAYLSFSKHSKTHLIYLPKKLARKVETWVSNYRKLQELLEEYFEVNREILKEQAKRVTTHKKNRRRTSL